MKKSDELLKNMFEKEEIKHYTLTEMINKISEYSKEKEKENILNIFINNTLREEVKRFEGILKLKYIAEKSNIPYNDFSRWKNNKLNFSKEKLNDILSVLDKAKHLL